MNYLAHSYLSYSDPQIVGQFLQDFIRNKDRFLYPTEIQQGIRLHRAIDTFTDAHPVIHEAKKLFSPLVRLYAGAFVDVAMDYFLANGLQEHELREHTARVCQALRNHQSLLPPGLLRMLESMERDQWLNQYRTELGIKYAMQNVLNKATYLEKDLAVHDLFLYYKDELEVYFHDFFPELLAYVAEVNDSFQENDDAAKK
ncbi:ACP phosphodiesterase [Chryseobacterium salipaludis]|uniref:acyl carrier protein phosphodiesterase n=1 Tax=Chryseobacterium TaxID=59732 RepID=UPI001FF26734|nr:MULTISPECIES: ACP phosphodiesterase [Chryseobacterium]MCJ8497690.1 ACP phosphodiesterase [Chryseobacterium salipaludis]MCX3296099.1 ACP phosphodiesterase [Planobacterium sp. JC490]